MTSTTTSTDGQRWRKSSYSGNDAQTNCVELAHVVGGGMAVQDSKNPGAVLVFGGPLWHQFTRVAKVGAWDVA